MKAKYVWPISAIFISLIAAVSVSAHCEIPCGIYDDQLRAQLIREHATTIEKSMKSIIELSKGSPINYNQLARWVSNKEAHANEVQHIVSQYFMTQRIKPEAEKYNEKLAALHELLISLYFGHGH